MYGEVNCRHSKLESGGMMVWWGRQRETEEWRSNGGHKSPGEHERRRNDWEGVGDRKRSERGKIVDDT